MKTIKVAIINSRLFSGIKKQKLELYIQNNVKLQIKIISMTDKIKKHLNHLTNSHKYDLVIFEGTSRNDINTLKLANNNESSVIISNVIDVNDYAKKSNLLTLDMSNDQFTRNGVLTNLGLEKFKQNLCLNYRKGIYRYGF